MWRFWMLVAILAFTFCHHGNTASVRDTSKTDKDELLHALERLDHLLSSITDSQEEVEVPPAAGTSQEETSQEVDSEEEYKRMGDGPMPYKRFGDGPMPYKRMGDGPMPYKRMGDGPMPYKRMGDGPMPYKRMGDGPMPYKRMGDGPMPYKRMGDGPMPYKRDEEYPDYWRYPDRGQNYYPSYDYAYYEPEKTKHKDLSLREVMQYLRGLENKEQRDHDIPFPVRSNVNDGRP